MKEFDVTKSNVLKLINQIYGPESSYEYAFISGGQIKAISRPDFDDLANLVLMTFKSQGLKANMSISFYRSDSEININNKTNNTVLLKDGKLSVN